MDFTEARRVAGFYVYTPQEALSLLQKITTDPNHIPTEAEMRKICAEERDPTAVAKAIHTSVQFMKIGPIVISPEVTDWDIMLVVDGIHLDTLMHHAEGWYGHMTMAYVRLRGIDQIRPIALSFSPLTDLAPFIKGIRQLVLDAATRIREVPSHDVTINQDPLLLQAVQSSYPEANIELGFYFVVRDRSFSGHQDAYNSALTEGVEDSWKAFWRKTLEPTPEQVKTMAMTDGMSLTLMKFARAPMIPLVLCASWFHVYNTMPKTIRDALHWWRVPRPSVCDCRGRIGCIHKLLAQFQRHGEWSTFDSIPMIGQGQGSVQPALLKTLWKLGGRTIENAVKPKGQSRREEELKVQDEKSQQPPSDIPIVTPPNERSPHNPTISHQAILVDKAESIQAEQVKPEEANSLRITTEYPDNPPSTHTPSPHNQLSRSSTVDKSCFDVTIPFILKLPSFVSTMSSRTIMDLMASYESSLDDPRALILDFCDRIDLAMGEDDLQAVFNVNLSCVVSCPNHAVQMVVGVPILNGSVFALQSSCDVCSTPGAVKTTPVGPFPPLLLYHEGSTYQQNITLGTVTYEPVAWIMGINGQWTSGFGTPVTQDCDLTVIYGRGHTPHPLEMMTNVLRETGPKG